MNYYDELDKLIASIDTIQKNAQGYNYRYADLPKILDAVMEKISKHGFTLKVRTVKTDGYIERDDGKVSFKMPCFVLITELIHRELGESIKSEIPLMYNDVDPQAYGSAQTYARRYALYELLNLTIEDDDGAKASAQSKSYTIDFKEITKNLVGMSAEEMNTYSKEIYALKPSSNQKEALMKIFSNGENK
jgi:hypothetical protein